MNPSVDNGLCSTSYKLLKTTQRLVNKNSLLWWYLFKTSWKCFKTYLRHVLKTFWKRLEEVLKASWRRLENVLKTYEQDVYIGLDEDQDVLKTSEDVWLIRIYLSSSRRLENVFWRQRRKTSSRCLQDVFIKTNVCWVVTIIFMNSFNAVHTFAVLKMEIILMMRTYYNNNL